MNRKKIAAALLSALVLVLALTGCVGHLFTVALTVDGVEISAGMYLLQQYNAFYTAESLAEDPDTDPRNQKIEGISGKTWIKNQAVENCRRIVAVEQLCEQYGVTLSEDSQSSLETSASYWSWISDYYLDNGIAYETWLRGTELDLLQGDLFNALYTGDGEKAWSREQLEQAMEGRFVPIRFYYITLTDSEGNELEDLSAFETALEKVLQELNNGATTLDDTLLEDLPGLYELLGAEYDEEALPTISVSNVDLEVEWDDFYTEEWLSELAAMAVGAYGTHYSGSSSVLIYQRVPPFNGDDELYEDTVASLTNQLRSTEYEEFLRSIYSEFTVQIPFGMQWYYRPSRIVA